jgi:hypothetical protein
MKPFLLVTAVLGAFCFFFSCQTVEDRSPLTASTVHLVFINSDPRDFFGQTTASVYGDFPSRGIQFAVREYWKRPVDVTELENLWKSCAGKSLPQLSSGFSRIYTLGATVPAGIKTMTLTIELLPSGPDLWEVRLLISRSTDGITLEYVVGEAGNPAELAARLTEWNQSIGYK